MAKTSFWICASCGFVNTPHALRRGEANAKCEQCGAKQDDELNVDIAPQDAVIAKRG